MFIITRTRGVRACASRSREGGSPADVMGRYRRRSEEVDGTGKACRITSSPDRKTAWLSIDSQGRVAAVCEK